MSLTIGPDSTSASEDSDDWGESDDDDAWDEDSPGVVLLTSFHH